MRRHAVTGTLISHQGALPLSMSRTINIPEGTVSATAGGLNGAVPGFRRPYADACSNLGKPSILRG
jgi:hypothetical protein